MKSTRGGRRAAAFAVVLFLGFPLTAQDTRPGERGERPTVSEIQRLLGSDDARGALDAATAALGFAPRDLELNLLACAAAYRMDDVRLARHYADVATTIAPTDPRGFEWSGFVLFRLGETEARATESSVTRMVAQASFLDAATCHAEARKLGGDGFKNAWFEAEALRQAGSFDRALAACDAALALKPKDASARVLKGRILNDAKRPADALAEFDAVLSETPDATEAGEAALNVITTHLATGDRVMLARRFKELTTRYPGTWAASMYRSMNNAFRGAGDDSFWPDLLASLASRGDSDTLGIYYRGDLALRRGRTKEALETLGHYVQLLPNEPYGWISLGTAQTMDGKLAEARTSLGRSFDLGVDRDDATKAFRTLVAAYHTARKYAEAAEVQAFVVYLTDDDADRLDHAVILLDAGRLDDAEKGYQLMLARRDLPAQTRAKVLNYLGLLRRGLSNLKEAEALFREAVQYWPDDLDAKENLAVLLIQTGRADQAKPLLDDCLRVESGRVRSIHHRLLAEFPGMP